MGILDRFKKKSDQPNDQQKPELKVDATKPMQEKPDHVKAVSDQNEKKVVKKVKVEDRRSKTAKSNVLGVLIRPLITEKATNIGQYNKYIFEVAESANKIQISQAIESRYGVKPQKINVINNMGRQVRYGRIMGKTKNWKKAVITLPEGQSI